ncbi:hypothetical protein Zmor_016085 [Zophobas morio]|uniref:carbonic anhydrase n=1 Tax=Zophobas morio TaxID=2755281 RepID=A0AA38MH76_9CUCU|nr:hypothetical protein Zmor_016085 [Zophobas morio]
MLIFVFITSVQILLCSGASEWSYENQDAWPPTCKGQEQSPIQIITKNAVDSCLKNFQFNRATSEKKKANVTNTGHTVEVRFVDESNPPTVSGGGLDGTYVFDSFHFHWAAEHVIDTRRYPLEGHFVYYSQKYQNLESALGDKGGVAVFAVFYQKVPFVFWNSAFNFVREVPLVAHKVDQPVTARDPVVLRDYLPKDCSGFYRYNGSLTTPDCNEVVVWTVFKRTRAISKFNKLVQIWDAEDQPVKNNYRDLQPLNGRRVLDSWC